MNWIRVITGIVVTFITILIVFIGGIVFSVSATIVATLALLEFYKLVLCDFFSFKNLFLIMLGLLNGIMLVLGSHIYGISKIVLILSFNFSAAVIIGIIIFNNDDKFFNNIMKQVFGLIYISTSLSFLVQIRNYDYGLWWSLMILSTVSASDIGAYYIGSFIGKHKICPKISPNKTLEGSLGGLFCSIVNVIIFKIYFFDFISILGCIFFACSIGVLGQFGDLFASKLKRIANVKDSGKLLPGHGGFLDRLDAVLLAIPLAYLFRFYILI